MDEIIVALQPDMSQGCFWLEEMLDLREQNLIDEAIDVVMAAFDDIFWAEGFEVADRWLRHLECPALGVDLVVCVLSITLCAKDKLKERAAFVDRAAAYLRLADPEDFDGLMGGLW